MIEAAQLAVGTQDFVDDPRNDAALVSVNGDLKPRAEAKVSVFDSGFVLGDGVWEGLRLVNGKILFLRRHFDRLWDGAKMLRIDLGLTREALKARLFDVIEANGMADGVHIRTHGDARRETLALSGPTSCDRRRDHCHHPGMEAPEARDLRARPQSFHGSRAQDRTGRAGPEAQLAFQAQLHPRVHPGDGGGRGRGAHARRPRLRRDLQPPRPSICKPLSSPASEAEQQSSPAWVRSIGPRPLRSPTCSLRWCGRGARGNDATISPRDGASACS